MYVFEKIKQTFYEYYKIIYKLILIFVYKILAFIIVD